MWIVVGSERRFFFEEIATIISLHLSQRNSEYMMTFIRSIGIIHSYRAKPSPAMQRLLIILSRQETPDRLVIFHFMLYTKSLPACVRPSTCDRTTLLCSLIRLEKHSQERCNTHDKYGARYIFDGRA